MLSRFFICLFFTLLLSACATINDKSDDLFDNSFDALDPLTQSTYEHVRALASTDGIGERTSGSANELAAAAYIQRKFENFGYVVQRQAFDYVNRDTGEAQSSQNIIAEKSGMSNQYIVIGAHYDSKAAELGSLGVTDNAASIATMLSVAEFASSLATQNIGIRFVAFGAEEVGLVGAKYHVFQMSDSQKQNTLGMINLDGIVGGDILYIHSAHSEPYNCDNGVDDYAHSAWLREQLLQVASEVTAQGTFTRHPGFETYPSGETGGWSDHAPFACAGIAIGNFEATNFSINGESGRDGYSQTVHPDLWTCFDPIVIGACNRDQEQKWGKIWHTEFDRLDILENIHPGRIQQQLSDNLKVLKAFINKLDANSAAAKGDVQI